MLKVIVSCNYIHFTLSGTYVHGDGGGVCVCECCRSENDVVLSRVFELNVCKRQHM